jgi:hypothetical protein
VKPTLDQFQAQIDFQDGEIARLAELAEEIPRDVTVPESFLRDIDDVTEAPPFGGGWHSHPTPIYGVRV